MSVSTISVYVKIGDIERPLDESESSWIHQQVRSLRAAGQQVCIRVRINTATVNAGLSTPVCTGGFGGGRQPNPQEAEIFALWEKRGLNRADFDPGQLVAFLRQLPRLI